MLVAYKVIRKRDPTGYFGAKSPGRFQRASLLADASKFARLRPFLH